jgi:hypothetical protein
MNKDTRPSTSVAFLWPALAAETASEFASAMAREFVNLAVGQDSVTEPRWTTRNKVALELTAVRLSDFSTGAGSAKTLVCAPFALHGATIVDFAPAATSISDVAELLGLSEAPEKEFVTRRMLHES